MTAPKLTLSRAQRDLLTRIANGAPHRATNGTYNALLGHGLIVSPTPAALRWKKVTSERAEAE